MNEISLYRQYRGLLLDGIVPFWQAHGVDEEYGGVLSCMTEAGERTATDKYIWSQARWVWTCSALYNRVDRRPELLRWARDTIAFLIRHGRDDRGRFVYHTTREGELVEGGISIYSDCFFIYGLSEYCRAVPDADLLSLARSTFESVRRRV